MNCQLSQHLITFGFDRAQQSQFQVIIGVTAKGTKPTPSVTGMTHMHHSYSCCLALLSTIRGRRGTPLKTATVVQVHAVACTDGIMEKSLIVCARIKGHVPQITEKLLTGRARNSVAMQT